MTLTVSMPVTRVLIMWMLWCI